MLQLSQRLGFDLPDSLARDRELLAYFFQRVILVHSDAKAHAQPPFFAWGDRGEHARRDVAQFRLDGGVDGLQCVLVLDEVAEAAIILVADRRLDGERLLRKPEDSPHLLQWYAELFGKLLRGGLVADLGEQPPRGADDLVGHLDHVDGDADSARLIRNPAGNRLADPPSCVSSEFVAAAVIELIYRL